MPKTYVTKQGDTWDSIAYELYGAEEGMNALLDVNNDYRQTVIFPSGIVLTVPEYTKPSTSNLPPWRR